MTDNRISMRAAMIADIAATILLKRDWSISKAIALASDIVDQSELTESNRTKLGDTEAVQSMMPDGETWATVGPGPAKVERSKAESLSELIPIFDDLKKSEQYEITMTFPIIPKIGFPAEMYRVCAEIIARYIDGRR